MERPPKPWGWRPPLNHVPLAMHHPSRKPQALSIERATPMIQNQELRKFDKKLQLCDLHIRRFKFGWQFEILPLPDIRSPSFKFGERV